MPANVIDCKLVVVFKALLKGASEGPKREKAVKKFHELRSRVVDIEFGRLLDGLFAEFSTPPTGRANPSAEQAAKTLGELRARGFVEVAGFLFRQWRDVMAAQKLEDVLPVVPNAASFEVWRKATRQPAKEIAGRLLADPVSTYATAGADWVLLHVKTEQALPLLGLFLGRKERPKTLPPALDALVPVLKKDKRGVLLERILRHPWPEKGNLVTLGEVVRLNRTLLKNTVASLPAILCKKDAPEQGAFLVEDLFALMPSTQGAEREFMTAVLARLGCGILVQDRRGPQADAILRLVAQAARRLRNITKGETIQARTWVLENLSAEAEPTDGKVHVTVQGARHLALAFEKAAQGFATKDILTATARNLGLTPVGNKGETASYNPLQHEDMEGGMLPGDGALIEEPGWALGSDVVMRAKVKRGGSHV
jgi:hypothetical protein